MSPESPYFEIRQTPGPPGGGYYPALVGADGTTLLTGPLCFTHRQAQIRASQAIQAIRHLSDDPIRDE